MSSSLLCFVHSFVRAPLSDSSSSSRSRTAITPGVDCKYTYTAVVYYIDELVVTTTALLLLLPDGREEGCREQQQREEEVPCKTSVGDATTTTTVEGQRCVRVRSFVRSFADDDVLVFIYVYLQDTVKYGGLFV